MTNRQFLLDIALRIAFGAACFFAGYFTGATHALRRCLEDIQKLTKPTSTDVLRKL